MRQRDEELRQHDADCRDAEAAQARLVVSVAYDVTRPLDPPNPHVEDTKHDGVRLEVLNRSSDPVYDLDFELCDPAQVHVFTGARVALLDPEDFGSTTRTAGETSASGYWHTAPTVDGANPGGKITFTDVRGQRWSRRGTDQPVRLLRVATDLDVRWRTEGAEQAPESSP